jgi:hypothetical protein
MGRFRGAEAAGLTHREVHLRALDAAHLADRPLQLALQRAPVVDALREVGHPPGRLIEELEAGTPRVGEPLLGQRHPGTGEVGRRHGHLRSTLLQAERDPAPREALRDHAGGLEREPV